MPMRFLTNDFKDCHLIKLDPSESGSPFIVSQEGCAPDDMTCKTKMFYLQRDGQWIDEIARSTRPDSEAGDVIFESPAEALELLSGLFGKPKVRQVSVTEAETEAYIAKMQSLASPEAGYRDFLARYRAAKRRR
jgi:hypothetical protein